MILNYNEIEQYHVDILNYILDNGERLCILDKYCNVNKAMFEDFLCENMKYSFLTYDDWSDSLWSPGDLSVYDIKKLQLERMKVMLKYRLFPYDYLNI